MSDRERILSAPPIGDGLPIWDRAGSPDDRYNLGGDSLARAFYKLGRENPGVLNSQDTAWAAFVERWPGGDEWLGGCSGFVVSWAYGAARWLAKEDTP